MISSCVSCGKVLAKSAPTSEVSWELCDDCVHAPYECLRQAAASAPLDWPALRYSGT